MCIFSHIYTSSSCNQFHWIVCCLLSFIVLCIFTFFLPDLNVFCRMFSVRFRAEARIIKSAHWHILLIRMALLKEGRLIAVNDAVNSSVRDNSNETKLSPSSKRRSFLKKCIVSKQTNYVKIQYKTNQIFEKC